MKSKNLRKLFVLSLVFIFVFSAFSPALALNRVRVWVEFAPGSRGNMQAALKNAGADFHYYFDDLNSFVVTLPENSLQAFRNNPNVVSLEEDPERSPVGVNPFNGFSAPSLDIAGPNGQTIPWGIDAVQARDVWDTNLDGTIDAGVAAGAGKTICIIDSGFSSAHEDLNGANLIGGTSQVDDDYTRDGSGHGSHVAGTIAGANNTLGVVGVSPNVSLYIVKYFNDSGLATFASDLVAAANTCASNGADIISMSLGGSRFNNRENRAFQNLFNDGILSIAAAGNAGTTDHLYPASYDSVMSVAALDENLALADFSQQTNQVEIAAPGVGVFSTVPYIDESSFTVGGTTYSANHIEYSARGSAAGPLVDGGLCTSSGDWTGAVVLCQRGDISFYDKVINAQSGGAAAAVIYNNAPGNFLGTLGDGNSSSIVALSLSQTDGQALVAGNLGSSGTVSSQYFWPISGYAHYNGTSMATPHVSAVAALIWSSVPSASNSQVRDALTTTAQDLGPAGRDDAYGHGLVQAASALAYLDGGTSTNDAPSVSIDSPANGSSFNSSETITFQGSAADTEDGDLSSSISWSSNLDGVLGTGANVSTTLSVGTHTITASVTDSGGKTGTDSITVTVDSGGTSSGALNITVSTNKTDYLSREIAVISVTVIDDESAPVAGASVEILIVAPKGKSYVDTGITDANGYIDFTFRVNINKDGSGTFTITATATKPDYADGSDTTSFTAN